MKKIKRIAPPRKPKSIWDVKYRPCHSGVAIDITYCQGDPKGSLPFRMTLASYLIPWETIDAWSKAPRGELITIKNTKHKTHDKTKRTHRS